MAVKAIKFVLISGLLLVVAGVLGQQFYSSKLFLIDKVEISLEGDLAAAPTALSGTPGARDAVLARIRSISESLRGFRVWNVDLRSLQTQILNDGWIAEASVARFFPNQIQVKVRPKKIVGVYVNRRGVAMPISSDGQLLNALEAHQKIELPTLRGDIFKSSPDRLKAAVELLQALPTEGKFANKNISEIGYVKDSGYIVNLISPNVEVLLGENSFDTKITRATQVMNYLSTNQLRGRVIDATFAKKVLVRLRKGP